MSIERPPFFCCNPRPTTEGPGRPGPSPTSHASHDYRCSAVRLALACALAPAALALAAVALAGLALAFAAAMTTAPTAAIHLLQLFGIKVTHVISFLKRKTKKISRTETLVFVLSS